MGVGAGPAPAVERRAHRRRRPAREGHRDLPMAAVSLHRTHGDVLRAVHGDVRRVPPAVAEPPADAGEHDQGPTALLSDAAGDPAVALCLQRLGRLAAVARERAPAAGRLGRDQRDGTRVAGANRRVLFGVHDELPVHAAPERRGLRRLGVLRGEVPAPDSPSSSRGRGALAGGAGYDAGGERRRPARPGPGPRRVRPGQDRLPRLGGRLRAGRGTDGMGPAAVHRQPNGAVRLAPQPRVQLLRGGLPARWKA